MDSYGASEMLARQRDTERTHMQVVHKLGGVLRPTMHGHEYGIEARHSEDSSVSCA